MCIMDLGGWTPLMETPPNPTPIYFSCYGPGLMIAWHWFDKFEFERASCFPIATVFYFSNSHPFNVFLNRKLSYGEG